VYTPESIKAPIFKRNKHVDNAYDTIDTKEYAALLAPG
jgi:hypothetical protein